LRIDGGNDPRWQRRLNIVQDTFVSQALRLPVKERLHRPYLSGSRDKLPHSCGESAVKPIGIFLSPYVRRVAVSLNLLNLPFEYDQVFVFAELDIVRRYNPLVRIPALVLDDISSRRIPLQGRRKTGSRESG
jgi:hypothetical protein